MLLGDLIQGLGITLDDPCDGSVRICDVTEDSRTAMPGSLFIARAGLRADGRRFIEQAVQAGAAAVLTDRACPRTQGATGVAWARCDDVALAEAMLGERFYGLPSQRLKLVGVTGTNGKTTVAHLTQQLLAAAGVRCGLLGTVIVDDGGGPVKSAMTTPPALELSYTLSRMVENGCRACAMEVSSHALDQKRTAALRFTVAVFTNLSGDHLDYHGSIEAYASAKARLFEGLAEDARAIVNIDDPAHTRMIERCPARVIRCTADDKRDADCRVTTVQSAPGGTPVRLEGPWGVIEGVSPLLGAYNGMNLLQSCAASYTLGAERDRIALALHSLRPPPGRMERVGDGTEPFTVYVDYAHSDDSLAKALAAVRPIARAGGGRVIAVFGCGGDRDRTKRPRMGAAAAAGADLVIVTSDNPRTEKPEAIISEILEGIPHAADRARVRVEPDRRGAIALAVEAAGPGDVVLVAGKGHEDYQLVSDGAGGVRRLEFDDRAEALAALKALRRPVAGGKEERSA